MTQRQWFGNNLLHSEEITCNDVFEEKLKNNDTNFINKLQYFFQCVPGSDSYRTIKKVDLISWIGHHVEQGGEAPSLFVTFSCPEYHWQDIEKLVSLRSVAEKVMVANDYSIIIQEYFQTRVERILKNYAKEVFGIHQYYARFEFTKIRGWIHVYILAILGKKSRIIKLNYLVYKEIHDVKKQAQVADDWMTNVFSLTSIQPGTSTGGVLYRTKIGKPEGACVTPLCHPVSQKLSEVTDYNLDMCNLCNCCQMHTCSGYCIYHQ
jgi:hypothetical protein